MMVFSNTNASALSTFSSKFTISRLPKIIFEPGSIKYLPNVARNFGTNIILITGGKSFESTIHWETLLETLTADSFTMHHYRILAEPSTQQVDEIVERHRGDAVDAIVGIGGGSVLDTAKAVAGLLPSGKSVLSFIENQGNTPPLQGPALPFIAVPTTAGTGSEVTQNAVVNIDGSQGLKKSYRHEHLVPDYAIVDSDLLSSCPQAQIAANAMDALTQLIESYLSIRANPFTDSLAESGIVAIKTGLFSWYQGQPDARAGQACLAYAALVSGVCLSITGLGAVHGLASPIGGFFSIPHGVVCGALLAETTQANIAALLDRSTHSEHLRKYAYISALLCGQPKGNLHSDLGELVITLKKLTEELNIPTLGDYGVTKQDCRHIIKNSRGGSMQTNPIVLSDDELSHILENCL